MCVHKYHLLFTVLFVFNAVLFAPNSDSLGGAVRVPQHRSLAGAQVAIQGPAVFETRTVPSDANGGFQRDGVAEGFAR
jgi:hypothetical protein